MAESWPQFRTVLRMGPESPVTIKKQKKSAPQHPNPDKHQRFPVGNNHRKESVNRM